MRAKRDNWRDLDQRIQRLKNKVSLSEQGYSSTSYSSQQNTAREQLLEKFDEIFQIKRIGDQFISAHEPPLPLFDLIKLIDGILTNPDLDLTTRPAVELEILYQYSQSEDKESLQQAIFNNILEMYNYHPKRSRQLINIDVEKELLPLLHHRDALKYSDPIRVKLEQLTTHVRTMLYEAPSAKEKADILSEINAYKYLLNDGNYEIHKENKGWLDKQKVWHSGFFKKMEALKAEVLELKQIITAHQQEESKKSDTASETTTEPLSEASSIQTQVEQWDGTSSFDNDLEEDEEEETLTYDDTASTTADDGKEDHDDVAFDEPAKPQSIITQQLETQVQQLKLKVPTLQEKIKGRLVLSSQEKIIQSMLTHVEQALSQSDLDIGDISCLAKITASLESELNRSNQKTWDKLSKEDKAFFLALQTDETFAQFAPMIHIYKPFMMQENAYTAYIRVLLELEALSNNTTSKHTEILQNIQTITEKIIRNPMDHKVFEWTDKQDQDTILRLFYYPTFAPLAEDIMHIYHGPNFQFLTERLKEKPLDIKEPPVITAETKKRIEPLRRYVVERENRPKVEKKALPLIAAFSELLETSSSAEEKRDIQQQIENTRILLAGDSTREKYDEAVQSYRTKAKAAQSSPLLNIQLVGSLMSQLDEANFDHEQPVVFHMNRVNTAFSQQHLAPLDKYIQKHPNTKLKNELNALMSTFSKMLESDNIQDQEEAIKSINHTVDLLYGRITPKAYEKIAEKAQGSPSTLWQVMGVLMMALSTAVLVFGTTTGIVPASVVGGLGIAAGLSLFSKAATRTGASQSMTDMTKSNLSEIKSNIDSNHPDGDSSEQDVRPKKT
ncbi:MAG: hypothetical protein P1U61_08425 [Legionellaceae bacterium]|nr:hypothetical protein [Legionellaceae bacterium]